MITLSFDSLGAGYYAFRMQYGKNHQVLLGSAKKFAMMPAPKPRMTFGYRQVALVSRMNCSKVRS